VSLIHVAPAPPRTDLPMRPRDELIDALRAFALFGILQVNIQSFVWGLSDPLGLFLAPPSLADAASYLLVATFVSTKFISIFAFLFGVGFALQMRKLRHWPQVAGAARAANASNANNVTDAAGALGVSPPALPWSMAQAIYRRRLAFLLAVGVAHGLLLYFGDILTAYALCGYVLVLFAGSRPTQIARATIACWTLYLILTVAIGVVFEVTRATASSSKDATAIAPDVLRQFAIYTSGGYVKQLAARSDDYRTSLIATLATAAPFILGLFLLGVLAGRLGWLRRPQRHARVWRVATRIGWASLPVAAAGAWLNFQEMANEPGDPSALGFTLMNLGSGVACLYVSAAVRWQGAGAMRAAISWLAPAGRMPLSNYLLQSLLVGALLSGWGLGLGASLGHAQLAALALVIVLLQVAASRVWIERFGAGPVESLWRRVTYGTPAA